LDDFGRIVFVGNCQIGAMWRVYERGAPREVAEKAVFIESYNAAAPQSRRAIAEADRLVLQVTEFEQEIGQIESPAPRFLVPMVICPFLWPFGGQPHPRNRDMPWLPGGPYPGEFGDEVLNRLIERGVDPDSAAAEYLAFDVARARNVGRMAEVALDRQRQRDAACGGYDVAGLIERQLPYEPLFRSRGHLNPSILRHLAQVLFSQLGGSSAFMQYLATTRYDDLVPRSEIPIHPTIAAQFGLSYVHPGRRYQFFNEGGYTFTEWAARYMAYAWNEDFHKAMHLASKGDLAEAIPLWEQSMEQSPRSSIGRANLAEILMRNGMAQCAVRWIREAAALEPENAEYARRGAEIIAQAEREEVSVPA
jgi:tetratricopeptide (TPR) repeat protein